MKTYWVWWNYISNFSAPRRVEAEDEQAAVAAVVGHYSDDFREMATVYVTTVRPEPYQGDLLRRAIKGPR